MSYPISVDISLCSGCTSHTETYRTHSLCPGKCLHHCRERTRSCGLGTGEYEDGRRRRAVSHVRLHSDGLRNGMDIYMCV